MKRQELRDAILAHLRDSARRSDKDDKAPTTERKPGTVTFFMG